ncbi:MAG TPA: cytochrome c oxidase subunit 3 [Thermoanaerobaculia bacterium]|nr:cytochrome c oxidase subunit 3 [Thermoanaerobaculia bacterium]
MASEIPYTSAERPDTGLTNGRIAVWLFLASEVMLFGALFASYVMLRAGAPSWPRPAALLDVPLATVNTLVLIASGVTMALARRAIRGGDLRGFRRFMGGTVLAGGLFLILESVEWAARIERGLLPSTNTFLALVFTLTGLHALHVLGGLAVNGYLWGPGARLQGSDTRHFALRVENAALYWFFVDLVWIVLFPVLYIL